MPRTHSPEADLPEADLRESAEPAAPAPIPGLRGRRTGDAEPPTNEPLGPDDRPDVGLTQSGSGEDAVVRRETEI